jgi:hypothetical protein
MGKTLRLNKSRPEVESTANIVGSASPVFTIEVPSALSYTLFQNALAKMFLVDSGSAAIPDVADVELWIENITGDIPQRIAEWQYGQFAQADQANREEQIRLVLPQSILMPELTKIIIKVNSTVAVDITKAGTDFLLEIDRQP